MSGFMDSHMHWTMIIDEEELVVHTDEPAAPSTGNDEEGGWEHDEDGHDDGEDVEHVVDDIIQQDNNDVADTRKTPLTSAVRDPHVQELLTKKTTDARGAAREKSKLRQLEIDSTTPLYKDCDPKETRLKPALELLEMKAKHKWSDKSADSLVKMIAFPKTTRTQKL